jgi:hypothetical protein
MKTKQNIEHNTENLKDYQYRCQEKQNTERRQTKQRTQHRKPKRLPVQIPEKTLFCLSSFFVLFFLGSVLVIF